MTTIPPTPPSTCDHKSKFPARHNGEPVCVECNVPVESHGFTPGGAAREAAVRTVGFLAVLDEWDNEIRAAAWDEGWKALEMWTGEDADAVNPYRKNASNE